MNFDINEKGLAPGEAIAYVDGSYSDEIKRFSYGIVMFAAYGYDADPEIKESHFSKSFGNPELSEMRNVAGEIMGAAQAIKSAFEAGCRKITVYHDYEGIAKWCTGEWRAKKEWTAKYKAFYDDLSEKIDVEFVKVKAHQASSGGTDAYYNNLADKLAREAIALAADKE